MTETSATASRRPARQGLFGGPVSSRRRPVQPYVEAASPEASPGTGGRKSSLKPRTVLNDALDLIRARKGRLAFGLLLMAVNRVTGLVIPYSTRFLLDDVIGKHDRQMLVWLVLFAASATLIQAATAFSLSQVLGKAAQRSITELRRDVQQHVGRLSVGYYEQTKAGTLLSRVMNDA
ncbi:MAG TPA: ABC transporter ATP-binding protein, partial [Thermoanaerobaculia bacterium]|nr:ABC transporter ATP-binding protein [Thermoanaerobaculia bacterium]